MTFQGAVLREQGITFAIVVVKYTALSIMSNAEELIQSFQSYFPGIPVILMGQDSRGTPKYVGRRDIVRFLANVSISRIPWRQYSA